MLGDSELLDCFHRLTSRLSEYMLALLKDLSTA